LVAARRFNRKTSAILEFAPLRGLWISIILWAGYRASTIRDIERNNNLIYEAALPFLHRQDKRFRALRHGETETAIS
jgi:hypothetical protein